MTPEQREKKRARVVKARALPPLDERAAARFFEKIDVRGRDECWLWEAGVFSQGYGAFQVCGQTYKAHRIAFALGHGVDPVDFDVDHKCHELRCCNPGHLRLATNKQNGENRRGAPRNSKSGFRGVNWFARDRKWAARVKHHGRVVFLGYFTDLAEAEAAVVAKRLELFTHNLVDRKAS
jgi:hypothetical protein